ncbi:MAG: hypothetical protein ACXW3Q_07845, partial [Rhodoplanes sp.]
SSAALQIFNKHPRPAQAGRTFQRQKFPIPNAPARSSALLSSAGVALGWKRLALAHGSLRHQLRPTRPPVRNASQGPRWGVMGARIVSLGAFCAGLRSAGDHYRAIGRVRGLSDVIRSAGLGTIWTGLQLLELGSGNK